MTDPRFDETKYETYVDEYPGLTAIIHLARCRRCDANPPHCVQFLFRYVCSHRRANHAHYRRGTRALVDADG